MPLCRSNTAADGNRPQLDKRGLQSEVIANSD